MLPGEYDVMRRVEDTYWWYLALRRHVVYVLERCALPPDSAAILDAGCGTGGMLEHLRAANPCWDLKGLDFSPLALAHAEKRGFPGLVQASVDAVPFPDQSFDAIVSLDVLYHEAVDEPKALEEFSRLLKSGGTLILNLPAFACLAGRHDRAVQGARRYTARQLRTLLLAHGFEIGTLHYWNAWLFLPILGWRLITRGLPDRAGPQSDLTPFPRWLNQSLALGARLEINLCRLLPPPFGTSIFAVARKKAPDASSHV